MSVTTFENTIDIEGFSIESREEDKYVNATQLCKAGGRLFSTYYRRNKTKEFIKELSMHVQFCTSTLIKFEQKSSRDKITWVHPQVAINIAQWISPKFDLLVSKWVYELLLFGNITLGKERSYEKLEKKLLESSELIKNLNKKLSVVTTEYKKLRKSHRQLLRHKKVHYFKRGKCVYIVSNEKEVDKESRIKVGMSCDINTRLKTLRTGMPYLRLHYLVFLNDNVLLETMLKRHYKDKLEPNNHEFITDTPKQVIKIVKQCISVIKALYTEASEDDLQRYNTATNKDTVNDNIIEKEIYEKSVHPGDKITQETEDISHQKKKEDDDEKYVKRCSGKFHTTEEDRMLDSSNFHKNRATKDGYSTYCKECTSKSRYHNKNNIERKQQTYDKDLYKWCPGKFHNNSNDRIIPKTDFYKNKSSKDGLTTYCKECTCARKYGQDRNRRRKLVPPPEGIDIDINKWCSYCEKILSRSEFHISKTSKDGLQNGCKICKKKIRK